MAERGLDLSEQAEAQAIQKPDDEEKREMEVLEYIDHHITDTLVQGLAELCKERPQDPLEFLGQFMMKEADK